LEIQNRLGGFPHSKAYVKKATKVAVESY
jgi:hypothetical protein